MGEGLECLRFVRDQAPRWLPHWPPAQVGGLVGLSDRRLTEPIPYGKEQVYPLLDRVVEGAGPVHRRHRLQIRGVDLDTELLGSFTRCGSVDGLAVLDVAGRTAGPPPIHVWRTSPQLQQHLGASLPLAQQEQVCRRDDGEPSLRHTAMGALIEGAAT